MVATRRQFMIAAGALGLTSAARARAPAETVTPEMFGAKGDGRTNDTRAFARMSQHVNARGGGEIVLRPVTYVVGAEQPSDGSTKRSFDPSDIIHLTNCNGPVTIEGNGATLRCAAGLRYGRFNRETGEPLPDPDHIDATGNAVPYVGMIHIENCGDTVTVNHIELDGNIQAMRIGGRDARSGWQSGGTGLRLTGNRGAELVSRVNSHHHPQDGMITVPVFDRVGSTEVSDSTFDYNGRQGCSITGGRNFKFARCKFRHTGRAVLHSNPGAGVDMEAESSPIENVAFSNCEFADNTGFGTVSGHRRSSNISYASCKFIATTNLGVWPDSPMTRFTNCLFVGTINHEHPSPDPAEASQFFNCTFTDDPSLSPTGTVFLGHGNGKYIAVVRPGQNVLFDHCRFDLVGEGLLPLSSPDVIYNSCDMRQRSSRISAPLGTYTGNTTIVGNARLSGSIIRGTVTLNGQLVRA